MAPKKKPTDELKDQRIPVMMAANELGAIDDWSFKNKIRSRGEAIRRLCHIGMMMSRDEFELEEMEALTEYNEFIDELSLSVASDEDRDKLNKFLKVTHRLSNSVATTIAIRMAVEKITIGETTQEALTSAADELDRLGKLLVERLEMPPQFEKPVEEAPSARKPRRNIQLDD